PAKENGTAMDGRFLSLCRSSTDIRSEQIAYLCIDRHACRCDYADDMGNWISRRVICIQGERSGIVFSVRTQRNLFNYLNRAGRVSDAARRVAGVVACPRHVIEFVREFSGLLPNS